MPGMAYGRPFLFGYFSGIENNYFNICSQFTVMPPTFEKNYCPYCGEGLSSKEIEEKDRDFCEACDRVIWRNASPVAAVIIREGDKILFVKRGIEPGKGLWSLPAGFLELRESPSEAAVRELEEETGLEVDEKDLNFVDVLNMERFPGQRLVATVYSIDFSEASGDISAGDDAEEAKFWSLEELRADEQQELRSQFIDAIEGL